ncbi:hypothetical protein [Cyanobium sp. ATX-6F1]|uniref:hypothetical protein n=1 Tax=Cyanobium sp. ATX-6F1 TaxID=3137388 RepID=UPI0039BDB0F4
MGEAALAQEIGQPLPIQPPRHPPGGQQGAQLGGEQQFAMAAVVQVEGLDAVGIAGQQGAAFLAIPEAEGVHAP